MIQLEMIKQTKNRTVILKCLTEPNIDCGDVPLYCASSICYMLETDFEYYGAVKPVSISQINRTLRDLYAAGLITKERRLEEPDTRDGLPRWVNYWQLSGEIDRNKLLLEIRNALQTAGKCHGTFLMTTDQYFCEPFKPDEKAAIITEIKGLMQKTHPDKTAGYESEFNELSQALVYCRARINLLKTSGKRLKLN